MNKNNAFSLIELSIVLIIISLIAAGVIGGKALIRTSELNSVIADVNSFKTAFNNYQMKYDAIPGDHKNAYDYFDGSGGSAICGGNNDGVGGCNGDGDGEIRAINIEGVRSWQHLSLAGLISGSYTGVINGTDYVSPGINAPASKIKGGGYRLYTERTPTPIRIGGHLIVLGKSTSIDNRDSLFSPADAKTIDRKMDDGKVFDGKVKGSDGFDVANEACGVVATGKYTLGNAFPACFMSFRIGQN